MLNKLQIIGHIGQDAKTTQFSDGNVIAHFSVATTEPSVTTSKGQVIPERTTWHRINLYGNLAAAVHQSLLKGTKVYCEGPLIQREYADKTTGEVVTTLEMDCRYIEFLTPKPKQQTPKPEDAEQTDNETIPEPTAPAPTADEAPAPKKRNGKQTS